MRKSNLALFAFLILSLFIAGCFICAPHTVKVEVCSASHLLPNPYCPEKEILEFKIGQQPTAICNIHQEPKTAICADTRKLAAKGCPNIEMIPQSEAPEFHCMRHARNPLARPFFVLAWLDGQSKVQRMSDEELDSAARRIGEAGVRWVRIFYPGWLDGKESILPYDRAEDGRFDLSKPNPAYDANLKRLAIALQKYEVGLFIDLADQCGWDSEWDCWRRNINSVYGWQHESAEAFIFWKAAVDRCISAIGGIEGNSFGLGNELRHIADGDLVGSCEWALAWGKPRIDYLISIGIERPILFSGCCNTAHKLMGCLSAEDGYYPDYRFVAQVIHGIGLDSHQPDGKPLGEWLQGLSILRCFGYSNDGVDTAEWNHVPKELAGTCDQSGGCSANLEEQIKVIKLFEHYIDENRFILIEYLPREISFDEKLSQIDQRSLDLFWQTALQVYGAEIRRSF